MNLRTLLLFAFFCPALARADFTVAGSYGKALEVSPQSTWQPSTVMLAPGYSFLEDFLRVEVGLALSLTDGARLPNGNLRSTDLQVRPMLVIAPPLLPVYGRVIAAVSDLTTTAKFQYGAAVGITGGLSNVHVFLEAGYVPIIVDSVTRHWLEGRVGLLYQFK